MLLRFGVPPIDAMSLVHDHEGNTTAPLGLPRGTLEGHHFQKTSPIETLEPPGGVFFTSCKPHEKT